MQLDNDHHKSADVEKAARSVLKELQQDYIDLFLIHWPLVSGCKGDTLQPPIKVPRCFYYCHPGHHKLCAPAILMMLWCSCGC